MIFYLKKRIFEKNFIIIFSYIETINFCFKYFFIRLLEMLQ